MKALKIVLVVVVFTFTLLTLFSISNVEAAEYLGEFCFNTTGESGSIAGDSGTAQFSVYDMENGTYSYTGVNIYGLEDNTKQSIMQGTAILKDNTIHVSHTDNGWQRNEGAYLMTYYFEIDATTLNGTFRGLEIEASLGNSGDAHYFSGSIVSIPCP